MSNKQKKLAPETWDFPTTLPPGSKAEAALAGTSEVAVKHDAGKPPMSLLSSVALEETAKVMAFGANKYAEHNWRKGFKWSRLLDASLRHILAFNAGEDKDPESGLSHLSHAACCIAFLQEFEKTHPEMDDRYKNGL